MKAATVLVMVNMELVTTSNIKNKINVIIEICSCENCALKFV